MRYQASKIEIRESLLTYHIDRYLYYKHHRTDCIENYMVQLEERERDEDVSDRRRRVVGYLYWSKYWHWHRRVFWRVPIAFVMVGVDAKENERDSPFHFHWCYLHDGSPRRCCCHHHRRRLRRCRLLVAAAGRGNTVFSVCSPCYHTVLYVQ